MATPLEITQQYFGALANGDMAKVAGLIDENCVWHQPGQNQFSGQHVGPKAIGQMIGAMMEVSGGTFNVSGAGEPMVNDEKVAVPVQFKGNREGASLDTTGIDLLTVKNDKIIRVDLFTLDSASEDAFWGN